MEAYLQEKLVSETRQRIDFNEEHYRYLPANLR